MRLALDLEHVESDVDVRRPGRAALHRGEGRSAVLADRDDLTVEDAVRRADTALERPHHGGEAAGQIVVGPAAELTGAAAKVRDGAVAVPLHLVEPALAGRDLLDERGEHRPVAVRRRPASWPRATCLLLVALADQKPVLRVAVELRRHERPRPVEALAVQPDREAAVALLLDQLVRPAVPDLDRAGAVVAGRDLPLEVRVVERMVLDVDGERAPARLERDALRDRPARERAIALEPEVVVEPPSVVPLHDEDGIGWPRGNLPVPPSPLPGSAFADRRFHRRFRRRLRVALAPVLAECHRRQLPGPADRRTAVDVSA